MNKTTNDVAERPTEAGEAGLSQAIFERRIAPHVLVKKETELDDWAKEFLHFTRWIVLGTVDEDGFISVSPRGGDEGFIQIIDDKAIRFDDLPGNNLMETHRNILANGRANLLCVIPGREEILRLRGVAHLDYHHCSPPSTGISVHISVDHWYYHCGRSLRLANAWKSDVIAANVARGFAKRPPSTGATK